MSSADGPTFSDAAPLSDTGEESTVAVAVQSTGKEDQATVEYLGGGECPTGGRTSVEALGMKLT